MTNNQFICIITASTPKQAEVFRALIERRQTAGLYPREIEFKVYSDPLAGRVGSGGGTLVALDSLIKEKKAPNADAFFKENRILIIHAGGESRRMPCFVPEGKLFAPIPVASSSSMPPVILDLQLSLFLKYPWKLGELVVCSGDVVIDFDVDSVPDERGDLCGFTTATSFEQGSRHGVFVLDSRDNKVTDFYQKAPVSTLLKSAAIEGTDTCALDMGIVSFSPKATSLLISLFNGAPPGLSSVASRILQGYYYCDLYLEIVTATLPNLTYEDFTERMKGATKLGERDLQHIYSIMHGADLRGCVTASTSFLHFGALNEFFDSSMALFTRELKPFYAKKSDEIIPICLSEEIIFNCSKVSVGGQKGNLVIEGSLNCRISDARGRNIISGLTISLDSAIPAGICIDERTLHGVTIRLAYSQGDTFKKQSSLADVLFCNRPIAQWLDERGLKPANIWDSDTVGDLYEARLFAHELSGGLLHCFWEADKQVLVFTKTFLSCQRLSLKEINALSNAVERDTHRQKIRLEILKNRLAQGIGFKEIPVQDIAALLKNNSSLTDSLRKIAKSTDDPVLLAYRNTVLDECTLGSEKNNHRIFFDVNYTTQPATISSVAVKDDQIVWARSPVRLDIAGGWSDTPPYTLKYGGQVVNLAVDLNSQPPIQVFVRKTVEKQIRIQSIDLGVAETISNWKALEEFNDPRSPFGLPKAALNLLGLKQKDSGSLREALVAIGAGCEITLLCAVPKGSGLGTSSVLAATILAALQRFFGIVCSKDELFRQVLQMEQMLTTGGGWQDQIGGIIGGVKYIESKAGLKPNPTIHQLDPWLFANTASKLHFTLFYTGITRLAKNILQDVVKNVNCNIPSYIFTVESTRKLALKAREAISLRDMQALARVMVSSWEANKRIHASTTNSEVDAMLLATREYYSGIKLLGAGGGGFTLFLSSDIETAKKLKEVLSNKFENNKARIVDFSLNPEGLQVTVS